MFCQNCGSSLDPGARFCAACGSSQPVEIGPGSPVRTAAAQPVLTGGQSETARWIGEGWDLVKDDLGAFVLMTIVMLVVNGAVPILLQGVTTAGFQAACKKKLRGVKPQIADLFSGFEFFVPTLVAHIVISILIFVGSLFFIIPGIMAAAAFNFTFLFIIDKRMDFETAMRASHAVVKQDYFGYCLFIVALFLLNVLGLVCLFVGLLVTIPITLAAITVAYRDTVGFE
jgi:Predicted integral membrane protein